MRPFTRGMLYLGVLLCLWFVNCGVGGEGIPCTTKEDCAPGLLCKEQVCERPKAEGAPDASGVDAVTESRDEPGSEREAVVLPDFEVQPDMGEPVLLDTTVTDGTDSTSRDELSEHSPEGLPDSTPSSGQPQSGLVSGGARMSSSRFKVYGAIGFVSLGAGKQMSGQRYRVRGRLLFAASP